MKERENVKKVINTDINNMNNEANPQEQAAYTYMVRCQDGSLYTGWTNNLEKRVKAHNEGKGAKYTRNRRPVELVYAEMHETKQEAMSREAKIKRFTKKEKEELAGSYQKSKKSDSLKINDKNENSEKI